MPVREFDDRLPLFLRINQKDDFDPELLEKIRRLVL